MIYIVEPMGAPRMTRADAWKKRPVVLRYRQFKDAVRAAEVFIPDEGATVTFVIPMPKSWSKNKRKAYNGTRHQQMPDVDNLLKAILDAVLIQDCGVWDVRAVKIWGETGQIRVES